MTKPMAEIDLQNILAMAEKRGFAHPADTILLVNEIMRLKRGEFTPEEFQEMCHNRHETPGCTSADFAAGCVQYQRQLFGPAEGEP